MVVHTRSFSYVGGRKSFSLGFESSLGKDIIMVVVVVVVAIIK